MILNDICGPCSVQVTQEIEMINKWLIKWVLEINRPVIIVSDLLMFEGL